jgi:uncharacterized protein (DUF486 family)
MKKYFNFLFDHSFGAAKLKEKNKKKTLFSFSLFFGFPIKDALTWDKIYKSKHTSTQVKLIKS